MIDVMIVFILGISFILNFLLSTQSAAPPSPPVVNNRPIIGILSQELTPKTQEKYPGKKCYIAASYIKFVEGAGGRAVPIFIGQNRTYYEDILRKVNGVLFPGGSTYFTNKNGYADAGEMIYDIIIDMNKNGTYIPIWGTCLGFELLTYLSANRLEHRNNCKSQDQALPLNFTKKYRFTRLFRKAPKEVLATLSSKNSTINYHQYCITKDTFNSLKLDKIWNVMSLNNDWNGLEFISSIEHKKYPIYGVQFHPEKNLYEFKRKSNITHDPDTIAVSQYFANFFVNETRRNLNSFGSDDEEMEVLIYNYNPTYTAKKGGSSFEQVYYFE